MTPFGLSSGSQFRLPPPPGLNTGKYAKDYNEVMLLGKNNSLYRGVMAFAMGVGGRS